MLPAWPGADRRSRIVFIARDIEERTFRDTLGIFTAADDAPGRVSAPLRPEALVGLYGDDM